LCPAATDGSPTVAVAGGSQAHEPRDSSAPILLAQGVPLEVVSELLWNASIRITKGSYGHLIGSQNTTPLRQIHRALWGG